MKRELVFFVVFCLGLVSAGNSTICPSGCDYASLSAWEEGEEGDLTGQGPAIAIITGGFVDDVQVTISGWITTADDYIMIITNGSARHNGAWDNDAYVLNVSNSALGNIYIRENFVRVDGLQSNVFCTSGTCRGIGIYTIDSGDSDVRISSNIIKMDASSTIDGIGIRSIDDADNSVSIFNTIIYNFNITGSRGMEFVDSGNYRVENVVLYNNNAGIVQTAGTVSINNSVNFGNVDDFSGVSNITYSASDDEDCSDSSCVAVSDWDDEFVDYLNGDFRLKPTSSLVDSGITLSSFSDDVVEVVRPIGDAWDIGAFEWNGNKGVIPEDSGQPFFVNSTFQNNPVELAEMNGGESQIVSWEVHANGTVGNTYEFFVFGGEGANYAESSRVMITIKGGTLTITLLNDTDFNVVNGTSFTFSVNLSCPVGDGDCDSGDLTLDPIVVSKLEELGVDVAEVREEMGLRKSEEEGFFGKVWDFLVGCFEGGGSLLACHNQ